MKKFIFLLLCTATLGLVSCKKDTIVNNILPRTILADISASSWQTDNGGVSYFADIDVPENDVDFNQSGGVIVSLSFDSGGQLFEALPNVNNGLSYSFTSEPDYVRIYIEHPIPQVIARPTQTIRAKIVLVDSEIID